MYIRSIHADAAIPMLRQLIVENPLGILTTGIRSDKYPFLQSSHIPFVLDVKDQNSETELGKLRGHLARSNPQSRALMEAAQNEQLGTEPFTECDSTILDDEVLVLFTSSAQHYVTPKFYTETKPKTGKVVPTWNYAAAQAYGKVRVYWNHKSKGSIEFLTQQIHDLSQHAEYSVMGHTGAEGNPKAWTVADAPSRYIEILRTNIIGIEIEIERLEGKFKMSQEMPLGDRDGVAAGFAQLGTETAQRISDIVKERSSSKELRGAV